MFRVFITTSQLSTIFMSIYAKTTADAGIKDILLIDNSPRKNTLIEIIKKTAINLHQWTDVIDLSIQLMDHHDTKPSFIKRTTRKYKNSLIVKPIYSFLFSIYQKKLNNVRINELSTQILKKQNNNTCVSINTLTQNLVNGSLKEIFPSAKINYLEHGIGDYFYVLQQKDKSYDFSCFFADEFKTYLANRYNTIYFSINNYISKKTFENAMENLTFLIEKKLDEFRLNSFRLVFILLDNADIFNPPDHFWNDFIVKCISSVDEKEKHFYLLKPHPNQSNGSMKKIQNVLSQSQLKYYIIDEPSLASLSAELLYFDLKNNIDYVFSTFSSASYYLSTYYSQQTKFYCLYHFVQPYFKNAPEQYKKTLIGYKELIDEVFAKKCIQL